MAGSPYSPYPNNAGAAAEENLLVLAERLRCWDPSAGVPSAVACLRTRSVRATLEAADAAAIQFGPSFYRAGAREQSAVPEWPPNLSADMMPLDLIAGYTCNEGALYVLEMFQRSRLHFNEETVGREVLAPLVAWLRLHGIPAPHEVLHFYGLDMAKFAAQRGTAVLSALEGLLGDLHVYCPVNYLVEEATAMGSNVFVYQFAHQPYYRWWALWKGVPQMLDLVYASGLVHAIQDEHGLDQKELWFSHQMALMFAGFVWNGEPPPQFKWIHWETFNQGPLVFENHENNTFSTMATSMPHKRNCAFWKKFLGPPPSAVATNVSSGR
ncbi:acetylcholinesterase-like [Haemaphysalis longicornis]